MPLDLIQLDDVIPAAYQEQILAELTSGRMPWFFREETARRVAGIDTSYSGFNNTVFHINDAGSAQSPITALLLPLLFMFCEKAGQPFQTLLRIRLGLFPRTMIDVPHHNPHVDFYQAHKTAVYYVNDSDGDTVVFNETFDEVSLEESTVYTAQGRFTEARRIPPRKGRMIGFDGRFYHASMHPLRHASRIAIAFSYL